MMKVKQFCTKLFPENTPTVLLSFWNMVDVGQWVYSIHREKRKIPFFIKEYMSNLPEIQDMGTVISSKLPNKNCV